MRRQKRPAEGQSEAQRRQLALALLGSNEQEDKDFLDRLMSGRGQVRPPPERIPDLGNAQRDFGPDRENGDIAWSPNGKAVNRIKHTINADQLLELPRQNNSGSADATRQETAKLGQNTTVRSLSPIYVDQESRHESLRITRRHRRPIAFGWYGGKYNHLDWLLPLLPEAHHYCEPFAGSGAVLINRRPSPVETYNDIDGEVVNFFGTLRDDPEGLIRVIALTPFSRKEFYHAINDSPVSLEPLKRARRFYVRARQARTGLAQTATLGRWANLQKYKPRRNVGCNFPVVRRSGSPSENRRAAASGANRKPTCDRRHPPIRQPSNTLLL